MMALSPRVRDMTGRVISQTVNSPGPANFNDYVKYARGALSTGQTPNAGGFSQYMGQTYGTPPPGGNKPGQQQPPAPVMTEGGQLNRVPMQGAAQPMPSMPPKGGRNLQYAAALSRMK